MNQPAYKVVAAELREAILQNRYPQGHRLPTEEELAAKFGLGRQTARRVFQELTAEGLIYRVRRRGTFAYPVSAPLTSTFGHLDDIVDFSAEDETEVLEPLFDAQPDDHVAEVLGLAGSIPGGLTIRRVQRSKILYYAQLRFPPEVTKLLAAEPVLTEDGLRGRFTIIGLIDREWGERIINLSEAIRPAAASKEISSHLGIAPRSAILAVERVYYDRIGRPVELAMTYYHPENFLLRSRLRR